VNLGRIDGETELRPAHKQRLQRTGRLDPRKLVAEAEMDARAEGDMAVRLSREVEVLRLLVHRRIHVRRGEHDHDAIALLQRHTFQLNVPPHIARF
jgi:hypothetical protein